MSWSYSGNPANSRKDAIRSLIGDVGPANGIATWYLTDQEISYFDSQTKTGFDSPFMSAAVCASILAGRFATAVNTSADGVSISGGDIQQKFLTLASNLRQQYKLIQGAGGAAYGGGIDAFEVPDLFTKPLSFGIGMDDNDRAGGQQFGRRQEWFDDETDGYGIYGGAVYGP